MRNISFNSGKLVVVPIETGRMQYDIVSMHEIEPKPHSTSDSKSSARSTNFRWVIIFLAFLITLINYMDRTALSFAIKPIKEEFGLTDEMFGSIQSAFSIGYMVMTLGGGIFVDWWGPRKVWSCAAILWSGCTCLMGTANHFWMMFGYRTMLGLAEGPHFPSLTRVVADWLPSAERARSTAIGLMAVPLALVIGAPLITNLIIHFGWKAMFLVLGGLGVVWAFIWFAVFRDYPENCKFVSDSELSYIREGKASARQKGDHELRSHSLSTGTTTWRFMLFNPSLLANNVAFFAFGYLLFFATTWLPGYFEMTYHLTLKNVGVFLIAPWLTAAILLASAGWLSDYLWMKTKSLRKARTHMIWVCQLLSALAFVPILFSPTLEVALLSISLGVGIGMMPNAAFYAINCDLAKDRAGTSIGLMDCFFALAGVLAPYLTGYSKTHTGDFRVAFGLLIGFSLAAVVAVLLMQKPDAPTDSTMEPTAAT